MIFISLPFVALLPTFAASAAHPDCGEFGIVGNGDWKGKVAVPKLDVTIHTKDVSFMVVLGEVWSLAWSVWCGLVLSVINIYLVIMIICRYKVLQHKSDGSVSLTKALEDEDVSPRRRATSELVFMESDTLESDANNQSFPQKFMDYMKADPVKIIQLSFTLGLTLVAVLGKVAKDYIAHKYYSDSPLDPRPEGTCVKSSGMPSGHAMTAVFALLFIWFFYFMSWWFYDPNHASRTTAELETPEVYQLQRSLSRNQSEDIAPAADEVAPSSPQDLNRRFAIKMSIALVGFGPIPFARVWLQDHTWAQIGWGALCGAVLAGLWIALIWLLFGNSLKKASSDDIFDLFTWFSKKGADHWVADAQLEGFGKITQYFVNEQNFTRVKLLVNGGTLVIVTVIIFLSLTVKRQ